MGSVAAVFSQGHGNHYLIMKIFCIWKTNSFYDCFFFIIDFLADQLVFN